MPVEALTEDVPAADAAPYDSAMAKKRPSRRSGEEKQPPKRKERTLFDPDERPILPDWEDLPFDVALLALDLLKGFGQKSLQTVVHKLGDELGKLFRLTHSQLAEYLRACQIPTPTRFAAELVERAVEIVRHAEDHVTRLEDRGISVIPPSRIPERLRSLNGDAPRWLFVEGDVSLLSHRPMVAVVGTRTPSDSAWGPTAEIAHILAPYEVAVVSGLADGIDSFAHSVSLKEGLRNVAILGHGINLTFPENSRYLRREIVNAGGAIVSEYMPDEVYQKRFFVARNRIQAGLADLVIPVEGQVTGGTAHTVRFARKYGRMLIGIWWKGAKGLVDELAANDEKVVDILTRDGQHELDEIVQSLFTGASEPPYPFAQVENQILHEMKVRRFREHDISRLTERIKRAALEPPTNGTP